MAVRTVRLCSARLLLPRPSLPAVPSVQQASYAASSFSVSYCVQHPPVAFTPEDGSAAPGLSASVSNSFLSRHGALAVPSVSRPCRPHSDRLPAAARPLQALGKGLALGGSQDRVCAGRFGVSRDAGTVNAVTLLHPRPGGGRSLPCAPRQLQTAGYRPGLGSRRRVPPQASWPPPLEGLLIPDPPGSRSSPTTLAGERLRPGAIRRPQSVRPHTPPHAWRLVGAQTGQPRPRPLALFPGYSRQRAASVHTAPPSLPPSLLPLPCSPSLLPHPC